MSKSADALMALLPRVRVPGIAKPLIAEGDVRGLLERLCPFIDAANEAMAPTGDHHVIPSQGYCLDCQGQHIGEWLGKS